MPLVSIFNEILKSNHLTCAELHFVKIFAFLETFTVNLFFGREAEPTRAMERLD